MTEAGKVAAAAKAIRTDGIEIATEDFGDPAHPPVLLIMGAMASMLWWPDEFCRRLSNSGRYVIRFDNRDTGLSTKYEHGRPGYTSADMVDDVVRVLDGYGLTSAHIVGMSMGGAIAQSVALEYPQRVLSLTAISTSPVGMDTSHLPPARPEYQDHSAEAGQVNWSDREQAVRSMVEEMRVLASPAHPFDKRTARRFVESDFDRSNSFASAANHFLLESGRKLRGRMAELRVPLLVIHGTADPLFPIEHGEALARAVPGAKLVRLEGGGHELNEAYWPLIIDAIEGHTQSHT
ncbi:alpha/beta hydrolase [Mesorhizobium sp. BAC0120]|uniref:alpha/beta fold hydrolase n=1 Tax=Mesorhizobium sp. BAC0120 TaxID=3090670 RepID=UPI00298C5C35|nr:alpha/beta hydrolase [Mesorhizobium sp. BAC0120]MDW6025259.1 alpha/beta hydrolase [Mesorhizobium sp. BAC0120]